TGEPAAGQLPAGAAGRGDGPHRAAPRVRRRQAHRPAVGPGRQEPVLRVGSQRHRERVPAGCRKRRSLPGDEPLHRAERDHAAQPYLAVGADRFGTFVGGGASLYWSDMLGNRNLVTVLQVNGGFKDVSALLAYVNARHRWNWGVAAQQVPYYSGAYGASID